jgi:chlorobactene glucosyltransferase
LYFTIFIYLIIGALAVLLVITLANATFGPALARAPKPDVFPRVSVLVPARNEAEYLHDCLQGLRQQDYPDFEILVLDDHSSDGTAAIIQGHEKQDGRVKYLAGSPLPENWLGKNWACHQLSQRAAGQILIFTDADLRYAPQIISQTVGWMQKLHLGLLTAFSQQFTETFSEKLIVPLLDMFVYSYLPLWRTYASPRPSLAAANGHWMAFTHGAYRRIGGHAAVHDHVVEDVALSRLAKQKGVKILALAGTGVIFGRMYENLRGIWAGYSKNLFGLLGFRAAPFFATLAMLFVLHLAPYFMLFRPETKLLAGIAVALNMALRLIISLRFAHPVLIGVLFHPAGVMAIIAIALNSYRWFKIGKGTWKERRLSLRPDRV